MAARVADALRGAGAEPVLAIGGDRPALEALGLTWVADRYPGEGPLGGILSAFGAVGDHDLVAILATDLPDLDAAVVRALVTGLGAHDVAVAGGEQAEPLCGVLAGGQVRARPDQRLRAGRAGRAPRHGPAGPGRRPGPGPAPAQRQPSR